MKGPLTDLSVRGPVLGKPALFTELLVVNRLKRLATASALDVDVGVSNSSVERVQLSEQPIASLDKLTLTTQLVQTLIAVANLFVQPTERVAQLTLNTAKRTCQRCLDAIQ
jgi:hypothetical protein